MDTSTIQERCWWDGLEMRVWMFVLNSKWYILVSPDMPLLKWRVTLVLTRARFLYFLNHKRDVGCDLFSSISQAVFHRFLISEDIHILLDILYPRECKCKFCISDQS